MTKKVLILLAGCGARDGSNPFETVFCATALETTGFEVIYGAPSGYQLQTVNHLDSSASNRSRRNTLVESARIASGKIFSLEELSPKQIDGIVIPGGEGVIKNFFTARGKKNATPKKGISTFLREHHDNNGIIAAFSISVSFLSLVFEKYDFSFDLLKLGSGQYMINKELRLIVAPGSISSGSLFSLQKGITNTIDEMASLIALEAEARRT